MVADSPRVGNLAANFSLQLVPISVDNSVYKRFLVA